MNRFNVLAFAILSSSTLLFTTSELHAEEFEEPGGLKASEVLRDNLQRGDHFRVDDKVRSDGYLNYYVLRSDYGDFEVTSTSLLAKRVREIDALTTIDDVSRTEVFLSAAADAGIGQLKTISEFATRPVETVTGIPQGIGRMFKRYSRKATEAVDATKEFVADSDSDDTTGKGESSDKVTDLTEGYFGVSGAERSWAQELGVDPYTSNEVLRAAIKEVAWADRLARFGMKFAPIPEIPGANVIGEVNNAVWSKDPYELADLNRARLVATGADEALVEEYLDNPRLTPTQQTYLTAAIAEMEGISGRDGILRQSLALETPTEVAFFVKSVSMLAWYHINKAPLSGVQTDFVIPRGLTEEGGATLLFASDYVFWTKTVADAADNYAAIRGDNADMPLELWLLGGMSKRTASELDARGIIVHTQLVELAD